MDKEAIEKIAQWLRPFCLKEVEGKGEDCIASWEECNLHTKTYWQREANLLIEFLESLGYVQRNKILEWLNEPCVLTAWNTEFDAKLHYKNDAGLPCYLHRKDCPKCWQRALAPEQTYYSPTTWPFYSI